MLWPLCCKLHAWTLLYPASQIKTLYRGKDMESNMTYYLSVWDVTALFANTYIVVTMLVL